MRCRRRCSRRTSHRRWHRRHRARRPAARDVCVAVGRRTRQNHRYQQQQRERARAASAEQQHAPFRSARSVARRDIRRSMHEPYEGLRLTVRPIRVRDICSPVSPRVAPPQVWSLLGHNHPTARRAEGYCSFFATAVVRRVTFSIRVPPRSRWPLRAAPPPSDHWHAQATFANGETVLSPAAQAELRFVRRDEPRRSRTCQASEQGIFGSVV